MEPNEKVAKELARLARELMSMEFDTDEQLKQYLKEHPDADKSKHTVKKKEEDKGESKKTPTKKDVKDVVKKVTEKKKEFSQKEKDNNAEEAYEKADELFPEVEETFGGDYEMAIDSMANKNYTPDEMVKEIEDIAGFLADGDEDKAEEALEKLID